MPKEGRPADDDHGLPEMEIQPYEHWDYIVLVFKDSRDWIQALSKFGIKKVQTKLAESGKVVTGLGRVIDGKRVLEMVKVPGEK
jgi:hypothetical protein